MKGANVKIVPASVPSHFKTRRSVKRPILIFLAGVLGFFVCGAIWFGIFSIAGMFPSPTDGVYWGKKYESVSDESVETMLIEHLSLASVRVSKTKPCIMEAASKIFAIIKNGCEDVNGRRGTHVANPSWWKGPPLLDPWRNVGGPRMRSGWRYEKKDNSGTIFVSLASFRDRRCPRTLVELFAKASRPDRISVGVVQQNEPEDPDCFAAYCKEAGANCRPENVRIIRIPAAESRGVMVVRHMASSLFEGEEYFLQLDAHNKVVENWDVNLIADLKKVKNERAVLSHHPPATDSFSSWSPRSAINICKYEWDGNGLPRFSANVVTAPGKGPFPGVFVGAGMVFARSELLIDCPFDPHLPFLFSGEELLLAACAFSHGWDIYNPSFTPVFHYYKGGKNGDKSINPVNDFVHAKSLKRLKYALGVEGSLESLDSGEFSSEFDRYAMGSARRLDQYYAYAGIDWKVKDKSFPFCETHKKEFYKFHNSLVKGLPALEKLSFDKAIPTRPAQYPAETGLELMDKSKSWWK